VVITGPQAVGQAILEVIVVLIIGNGELGIIVGAQVVVVVLLSLVIAPDQCHHH